MTGKYNIEIYNNRVHYFLTVKRNFTILQGDSATGKTELIRLIGEYEANRQSSGITLKCEVECTVLTPVDWELRIHSLRNKIIFIDETAPFLKSKRFAELALGSDNYFIIVTRDALSQLPYSIEEIYGLRNASDSEKYKSYKKIYNEMYHLYQNQTGTSEDFDTVVIEDSGSGFEFYKQIYSKRCISANGKSNVYDIIRSTGDIKILAIVDGAAFGSEMGKLYRYIRSAHKPIAIYAPESFEYVILSSGIIHVPQTILDETYMYADSMTYISWEDFFTKYLIQKTKGSIYQYSKAKLKDAYKTIGTINKVIAILPEAIRP